MCVSLPRNAFNFITGKGNYEPRRIREVYFFSMVYYNFLGKMLKKKIRFGIP